MDPTRIITQAGRRWLVRPGADPLLADGWPVDQPARLSLRKEGRRRRTYRLEAGGRGYYVKVHAGGGLLRALRARLGFGPGRQEWRTLLAAGAAGLPAPEPVAVSLDARETLVTAEVPGGRRLDEVLLERYYPPGTDDPPYPGARPPELASVYRTRRRPAEEEVPSPSALADLLADLVARLAAADLYLPDLHPGNLLLAGEPGAWRLVLVDLAEAARPAPPEATLKHLVQLEHFFEPIATAAERVRCLARLRQRGARAPDARAVARATAIYRERFYRGRDRRTRRRSKYFRPVKAGGWRGWATTDWAEAVEALAESLAPGADPPGAEVLKAGRSSRVWTVTVGDGRSLVGKCDLRAGSRGGGPLRPPRAVTGFRRGHALLARGIATARPAAALYRRGEGGKAAAILLTQRVPEAQPLSHWLRAGPAPAARRHVTWALARLLRRMHEAGFAHRDLKAPNVLVAPADGARPRPVLVDLDGLRRGRHVSARRRQRDLMRLGVSLEEWGVARATDRLRFLRTYLGRPGAGQPVTVRARGRGRPEPAERLRRWWEATAREAERKRAALCARYGQVDRL